MRPGRPTGPFLFFPKLEEAGLARSEGHMLRLQTKSYPLSDPMSDKVCPGPIVRSRYCSLRNGTSFAEEVVGEECSTFSIRGLT
jgi:hypothetical protein